MTHSSRTQSSLDKQGDISFLGPIFGAHIERLGVWRVVLGGGSMYLYIPFMIFVHTSFTLIIYQTLLRPLLRTPRVRWRDHVIIDRHRIEGLTWFDKLNCMFCGYANGVCTMMNKELDHVADLNHAVSPWIWPLLLPGLFFLVLLYLLGEIPLQPIFNLLISRPLGMQRTSYAQAQATLRQHAYARSLPWGLRWPLLLGKNHALRFAMALEQIESSWCPLRHFERRQGIVYPQHHRQFFGPQQVRAMYETLRTRGTVSVRCDDQR